MGPGGQVAQPMAGRRWASRALGVYRRRPLAGPAGCPARAAARVMRRRLALPPETRLGRVARCGAALPRPPGRACACPVGREWPKERQRRAYRSPRQSASEFLFGDGVGTFPGGHGPGRQICRRLCFLVSRVRDPKSSGGSEPWRRTMGAHGPRIPCASLRIRWNYSRVGEPVAEVLPRCRRDRRGATMLRKRSQPGGLSRHCNTCLARAGHRAR